MPTVNDDLRDRLLAHQIGIRRLSTAEVNKILRLLERGEKELRRELARRLATFQLLPGEVDTPLGIIRLEALLDDLLKIRKDYISRLYQTLAADLEELGAYEVGFLAGSVRTVVPIALDLAVASDDLIRAIVRSRPFQGRLLRHHFSNLVSKNGAAAKAMREAIENGLLTGQPLMGIVRKVNAAALGLERRAVTAIVHTAVHHVSGHMRDEVARLNQDIIEAQQWLATLDTKTCMLCAPRDGHLYHPDTHEPLDGGLPWLDGPGRLHFNDRCDSTYVLKSWKDMGIDAEELTGRMRASMNGEVPAETTYEQWLRGRSNEDIDRVFGKRKGQLWREGKLSAEGMLNKRGTQPLTLKELGAFDAD